MLFRSLDETFRLSLSRAHTHQPHGSGSNFSRRPCSSAFVFLTTCELAHSRLLDARTETQRVTPRGEVEICASDFRDRIGKYCSRTRTCGFPVKIQWFTFLRSEVVFSSAFYCSQPAPQGRGRCKIYLPYLHTHVYIYHVCMW